MEPDLPTKRAFLAQASVWPEPTDQVRLIDTHLAVVFLTDRHAYKLKRPSGEPTWISARWPLAAAAVRRRST